MSAACSTSLKRCFAHFDCIMPATCLTIRNWAQPCVWLRSPAVLCFDVCIPSWCGIWWRPSCCWALEHLIVFPMKKWVLYMTCIPIQVENHGHGEKMQLCMGQFGISHRVLRVVNTSTTHAVILQLNCRGKALHAQTPRPLVHIQTLPVTLPL